VIAFVALCAIGAAVIAAVIHGARTRVATSGPPRSGIEAPSAGAGTTEPRTRLYFRSAAGDQSFGKLAYVELGTPEQERTAVDLPCDVVHASGGRGICLGIERGVLSTFVAKIFDLADHRVRATLPLSGLPSRTRVARDGRIGATTVFVTGHGYDSVDFSTQTLLLDLDTGATIADVEQFEFFSNGTQIREADFNVWGVTFLDDSNTFYATLSTQGRHLLVRGDVRARRADVVHDDVECPSVSPDGTHVAFKRRYLENEFVRWQLYVLDLRTGVETALGERRSVDDQLEWLDDGRVLYTLIDPTGIVGNSVWTIRTDGSGVADRFLVAASSPAVVR
jgi:hypothetical protein